MGLTLLVLAAGLGSRFGGLKQLEEIDGNGHSIMDYSIFDALHSGFEKVILIVQEAMIPVLSSRYIADKKWPVSFVVQKKEITLQGQSYLHSKPWGTAHALWCAKEFIQENFLVINADDFYGQNSFRLAYNHLSNAANPCAILYPVLKTISDYGSVNRAEALVEYGLLKSSVERSHIKLEHEKLLYTNEDGTTGTIDSNALVSMNMWGFTPAIFDFIDVDIIRFIEKWKANNVLDYQLPEVVAKMIADKICQVDAITTNEEWIGITYQNDKALAQKKIQKLIDSGLYVAFHESGN